MNEFETYNEKIKELERTRRRIVAEMMERPFGDRVMADNLESELEEIENLLLTTPPIIGTHHHQPIYMGRGLLPEEGEGSEVSGLLTMDAASIQVIPESQWPAYIEGQNAEQQLHVEPYVRFTMNQGSVGSCAAEGGAGCVMAMRVQSGQTHVTLNPYMIYQTTSGGRDAGSTLSATVSFLRNSGCASAAVWPRSNGWRTTPSQAAREDALKYRQLKVVQVRNWAEYGTMLLHAYPVYSGYSGHAWFGTRLIAPNRIRWKNSWGAGWGEDGYGTLSSSSIMQSYGMYVFVSVSEGGE